MRPEGMLKVAAVIPARNEEDTILHIMSDLVDQTYPVDKIIVVNDCSTDGTGEILRTLQTHVSWLMPIDKEVPSLRGGAINRGLNNLDETDFDLAVIADADSRIDLNLVQEAVRSFSSNRRLGGVCSTAGVLPLKLSTISWWKRIEAWWLWRLQRLEYAGFNAERVATWRNVLILHGMCSVFNLGAIKSVGGYTPNHLIEDYDLTLKLKEAGWETIFNPKMKAWTNVPVTFQALVRQRLRWMRGGIDVLLDHGINRFTAEDVLNHALFVSLFLSVALNCIFGTTGGWQVNTHWYPVALVLAGAGYLSSLYRLKYVEKLDATDVIVRATVIPELAMAVAMSVCQLYSYYLALFRRDQSW